MPETFEHILIPYDNSESARVALRTAVNLCKRFDSRLTLVQVNATEDDKRKVRKLAEKIKRRTGKDLLFLHPSGSINTEVVNAAKSSGADLLIMGTHGTNGVQDFFIGSNAFKVVSSCSIPVMTMRDSFVGDEFKRIVIPIDDSTESRQKIPMARKMANYFDAEICVLGTSKWDSTEVQDRVTRYAEQAVDLFNNEGIKTRIHTSFGGNIAQITMDYAAEVRADLIIAMSETEPSAGFFMGANAQRLVNHAERPVLTVHAKEVVIGVAGY